MSPENTTPELPVDRPTKMRWGCLLSLLLGGVVGVLGLMPDRHHGYRTSGPITIAGFQAQHIFHATMLYAQDHDGKFPTAETNSNQAFRQLFPDYMEGEKSFYVPGSAWHDPAPGKRPDDDIGSPPDYAKCLGRGENHWAYVAGLDPSSPLLPIVADGFVENQPGTYTDDHAKKGGVWKGTKAIVVYADGSARAVPLSKETHFRVLRTKAGQQVDMFTREGGLPESARVLNPE